MQHRWNTRGTMVTYNELCVRSFSDNLVPKDWQLLEVVAPLRVGAVLWSRCGMQFPDGFCRPCPDNDDGGTCACPISADNLA